MFGTFLFLTYYMQAVLGYSALKTGFAFLPFSAGIIFSATWLARCSPGLGPRALMCFGLPAGCDRLGVVHPDRRAHELRDARAAG